MTLRSVVTGGPLVANALLVGCGGGGGGSSGSNTTHPSPPSSLFTIGNQFPTAACPLNGWATNQLLDSDHTDAIAYILFQENHAPFVCGSTMPDRVWFQ